MNDRRDTRAIDERVTSTYRDLANERAPQHLNDRVLRMAASAKTSRSLIPARWMKPVAWAATIGLSLAIVLELTQVPQPPETNGVSQGFIEKGPAADVPAHDGLSTDATFVESNERERSAAGPALADPPSATPQDTPTTRRDTKPAVPRAAKPTTKEAAGQAPILVPEPMATSATADDPARGDADTPVAASSIALRAEKTSSAEPLLCPAELRESADEWYRCIEGKRASSPAAAIARELDALRYRFPDFRIPATDR